MWVINDVRSQKWLAAVAMVAVATTAWAHHSFSAEFDTSKPVVVTGVITAISLVNPHADFKLNVQGAELKVQIGPPQELAAKKLTPDRFKVGTTVVVRGAPSKTDKSLLGAISMTFPDGTVAEKLDEWTFKGGSVRTGNPSK
jgi:Family of unknown function (DUF6152)